jgi:hypothetical protein
VERLLGVETEYALGTADGHGASARAGPVLEALLRSARNRLATLPDEMSHGVFLQNGSRFYADCGGHPEFTTPECDNPWDVVRYIRAGEAILLRLAATVGGRRSGRPALFRCNVDYSGTGTTWGRHESVMHRADPARLPEQMIPHLVSRLVYAGAGGFDNVAPGIRFTLSPRAVHIARDVSHDSTSNRGIFHTKDEPLCGNGYHRLHVICGESLCSDLATWLKVGTTALVVALCEAGLRPGEAVALRDPVAALRLFAGDPTCTAVAETLRGEGLTALAIQRHYLTRAEAYLRHPCMPVWADEVCRRWRAVLDALSGGPDSAATSLDWAIKRSLYQEEARRRGFGWELVETWSGVASALAAALKRAGTPRQSLTARLVLDRRSPIAGEVSRLGATVLREHGLGWSGFGAFLALRDRLFEIDMRFGQLGREGIFSALDAAGVLLHHVDGVEDIERAVDEPPAVPRARIRGELVRTLTGHGGRYCCDWEGVWDCREGRRMDLGDPFAAVAEWTAWDEDGDAVPPERFMSAMEVRLLMGRRRRRSAARERPDPVGLSQAALELRKRNLLDEAERVLRQAIELEDTQVAADSPKRPHRRNNLALVLLRAGRIEEAERWAAEAWGLKTGRHDVTSGRILVVRVALRLLRDDPGVGFFLGQLKTLLSCDALECLGDVAPVWEVPDVLEMLHAKLRTTDAELLTAIVVTLDGAGDRSALERFGAWNAAPAIPLEAPCPAAEGPAREARES